MALRNAFADLATLQVMKDIQYLLTTIAGKLGTNDGTGRMLVTAVVTSAPSTAVTGTITANQGTAHASAVWPVTVRESNLDQHYQSNAAFAAAVRNRITVA